jgi:hypothetical protein
MSLSMTARARWTSLSTRVIQGDNMVLGLGMHEGRWDQVFCAGGATRLARAAVLKRVCRSSAEAGVG